MFNTLGIYTKNLPKLTVYVYLVLSLMAFSACDKPKAPDFKRISNVKPKNVSLQAIELTGDAEFYNPNTFKSNVKSFDVDVFVNGNKAGKITQIEKTEIPPNQDVSIPFVARIDPKDISAGLVADIVDIFSKKKKTLHLHYKGVVVVKASALSFKVPVDFKDEVEVKL